MGLILQTPFLKQTVRKIREFDRKVSNSLIRVDKYIQSNKVLRQVFMPEAQEEVNALSEFLDTDLIAKMMPMILKEEKAKEERMKRVLATLG